jgi:hypothetical protein
VSLLQATLRVDTLTKNEAAIDIFKNLFFIVYFVCHAKIVIFQKWES